MKCLSSMVKFINNNNNNNNNNKVHCCNDTFTDLLFYIAAGKEYLKEYKLFLFLRC